MKINLKLFLYIIIVIIIISSVIMIINIKPNSISTSNKYTVDSTLYNGHTYYIFHQGVTNSFIHSPECKECYRLFD